MPLTVDALKEELLLRLPEDVTIDKLTMETRSDIRGSHVEISGLASLPPSPVKKSFSTYMPLSILELDSNVIDLAKDVDVQLRLALGLSLPSWYPVTQNVGDPTPPPTHPAPPPPNGVQYAAQYTGNNAVGQIAWANAPQPIMGAHRNAAAPQETLQVGRPSRRVRPGSGIEFRAQSEQNNQ